MPGLVTENWIERRARLTPGRAFLVCDGESWTFAEAASIARDRAGRLAALAEGIGAGRSSGRATPRVALLSNNEPSFVWWLLAILDLGWTAVPLNTRLAVHELAVQVDDCAPLVLLYDEACAEAAGELREHAPVVASFAEAHAQDPLAVEVRQEWDLEGTVATVMYTSGSTGRPKGVEQTLANHWHSAVNSALNLGLDVAGDTWGCMTPLFHMSGLSIVMRSLIYGCTVRLYRHFDAATVDDDLVSGHLTCLSAVTYQIERMLDDLLSRAVPERIDPRVRFVLQGGGPLPLATLERCREAGLPVVQSYGMTETASQIVALSPVDAERKAGSAGQPLASVRVRIAGPDGADDVPVPPGTCGNILIKTPTLAVGYLNQHDRYQSHFTPCGWFDTGDLGHFDEEGFLYVDCRLSDLIVSGGENVYPAEVEAVVSLHPMVARCAVVGVEDQTWGAVPVAVCVPVDGLSPDYPELPGDEEMRSFCRARLAGYKCPRRVVWTHSIPTTASGKLRRSEVARLAAAV